MPAKKKGAPSVGTALLRQRFHRSKGYEHSDVSRLHTLDEGDGAPALVSVIDRSDLEELMHNAELAEKDFTADRGAAHVVLSSEAAAALSGLSVREKRELQLAEEELHRASLKIPRRPAWHSQMTAEEVDAQERKAFLEWRRGLARLEDNERLVLTPFEKNLDIWRQLWRVVERSDLTVQIVDSRNPLLYRCLDLEAYVSELDPLKRTMLLLNKADLLPPSARRAWVKYLEEHGIGFLFWSAKDASTDLEGKPSKEAPYPVWKEEAVGGEIEESIRVLGRAELLQRLEAEAKAVAVERRARASKGGGNLAPDSALGPASAPAGSGSVGGGGSERRMAVVGFVGYPNVGKSSTINALAGQKKTGVTSTPGKTKHFQTLLVSDELMLCDCPGLVFPSFSTSRSEMVAAGVLPIDRLTDHRGPVEVVAERVPRQVLEQTYGLVLPRPAAHEPQDRQPTAAELLRAYARSRGYVASSGLPDETRASRQLLKDYLNGRLLDYHLPPDVKGSAAVAERRPVGEEAGRVGHRSKEEEEGEDEDEESEWEEYDDEEEEREEESGDEPSEAQKGDEDEGLQGAQQSESSSREKRSSTSTATSTSAGAVPGKALDGSRGRVAGSSAGGSIASSFDDFDSLSLMGEVQGGRQRRQPLRAEHKMHKKGARKKDRTWRVGHGGKDDSDGMPLARAIQKPVSHGAAMQATVLPADRKKIGLE